MYTNGSTEFNTAIETPNNKAVKKRIVFTDSGAIIDKFKTLVLHSSSNTSELQIGTTNMSYLDIELFTDTPIYNGQTFTLECGVELEDGSVEYAPMGVFTAQNVKREVDTIKFVANDNMQKLEKLHTSSLTYPTTSDRIVEEICDLCGIELETPIDNPITVSEKLQGYTCREMIGFIAGIQGKFACFGRNGRLNLRWYSDSPIEIKTGLIWAFTHSQDTFAVGKIEIAKDTETKFTSGDGINAILHSNPLATQQISDNIFAELNGFSYSTCNIKMLDDIRLDIWDMVKVNYFDGNTYLIPCMSIRQDMGASSTQIEAFSKSSTENQYRYTGATTQYLNRLATEILITNRVVSEKVDAEYVQAHAITTDNLDAIEANIKIAVIDDISSKFISTDQIVVIEANIKEAVIEDLEADFGKISILESEVADINTLIFGSATGNVIQTQFANSVIAQLGDAQIKSAMIQDVSASKITAGDIITNNVRVKSEDGSLLISDETIQISDKNRVRVQIGKDASNDYSINIWDKDGNLMFSQGGITDSAIKSAIIRDNMVSDTANIAASKLNISSLFTEINNNETRSIRATKIYLDEYGQSLEYAFKRMTTTVDGVTQTQTSQGSQLNMLMESIDTKIWKQDIVTAVKGIDVGGRNILRDTKTMTFANGFVKASKTITIEDDGTGIYIATLPSDSEWDTVNFYFPDTIENVEGKEVTLSFDAKSDGLTLDVKQWYIYVGLFNSDNERIKYAVISAFNNSDKFNTEDYVDGEWVRCYVTFKLPTVEEMSIDEKNAHLENQEYIKYVLQIYSGVLNDTYPIQIRKVKCEYGNKATDWTVAPEDTEGELLGLTTQYSTLKQTLTSFETTVYATFATKNDVSTQYSALEQSLDGFRTTVSNTYATKKDFDALNVGVTNILRDTKTMTKDNGFVKYTNTINVEIDDKGYGVATLPADALWDSVNFYLPYELEEFDSFIGKEATLSVEVKSDGLTLKKNQWIVSASVFNQNNTRLKGTTIAYLNDSNKFNTEDYVDGEWVRCRVTFVFPTIEQMSDFATGEIYRYALQIFSSTSNDVYPIQIRKVKCEFGNKATEWSPAPEDADFEFETLSYKYSTLEQNVNGFKTTVSETYATNSKVNSIYTTLTTNYSTLEQDISGFKTTVSETYATKTALNSVSTVATQTANKFEWIVKSGTSSSNFTLTDRMAELTASIISLNGNVKVNGGMIVDGAITADKISTNAITSEKISSNSVTADKIAIGDFTNLSVISPDGYNPNAYEVETDANNVKWFKFGSDTTLGYYSVYMNYISPNATFKKGDKYLFRGLVRASMETSIRVCLRALYSDGTSYTNMASAYFENVTTEQAYIEIPITINSLPNSGAELKHYALFLETRNTKLGILYVRELSVQQMTGNVLIADGAITADKINVSDLFAQDIVASGSITSPILKSADYVYDSGDYTRDGMIVDLKNKLIKTTNFAVKSDGSIVVNDGIFKGKVTATSGEITGNLAFGSSGSITHTNGDYSVTLKSVASNAGLGIFYITDRSSGTATYPFRVNGNGSVVATNITATGKLNASSGSTIGGENGWEITSNQIRSKNLGLTSANTNEPRLTISTGNSVEDTFILAPDCFLLGTWQDANKTKRLGARFIGNVEIHGSCDILGAATAMNMAITGGSFNIGNGIFAVDTSGNLTTKSINATGGTIGNLRIQDGALTGTDTSSNMAIYPNGQKFYINGSSTNYDTFYLVITGTGGKVAGLTKDGWKTING